MFKNLFAVSLVVFSISTYAVDCSGKVTQLGFDVNWSNPQITLSLEGGPYDIRLCGLTAKFNNIEPSVCKILHSELLAAKLAGRTVTFRFGGYDNCSQIPGWEATPITWHTFN
jgi:hypothetical protein